MSTNGCLDKRASRGLILVVCCLSWLIGACSRASTTDAAPTASSSSSAASQPPPRPAGPEELALVAPLAVGSSLADFEVLEIHAVQKGVLDVVCRKGRTVIRLWVALASDKGPEPPAEAGKYAIFYSVRSGDPTDAERLAKALAEIVGKHSDVPVPQGMTEFVPTAIPL